MSDTFSFTIFSDNEVCKLLKDINVSKSTGCDGIPALCIRDGADIISSPLVYIVNLSLTTGVVPSDLKLAHVVPLYTKVTNIFKAIIDLCLFCQLYLRYLHG